jgi:dephospho-CoA kinase
MNWKNGKVVVGLTGGIACGKSLALGCFRDIGWSVLSSDLITAEILASDKTVRQEIEQRWGRNVLARGGSIDKTAIARIVFGKELERRWLESLLHPIIRSKWISFVQSCPSPKCMIELPLLFEKNLQTYFTSTIAIFSPKATMIKRLQIRGLSLEESQQRIESQLAVIDKMNLADYGLWGGGTAEFLSHQINLLNSKLC